MKTIIATKHTEFNTIQLELNNPPANTFTVDLLNDLSYWLLAAGKDPMLKSIILTGKGLFFSLGGDLHEMQKGVDNNEPSWYVENIVPLINKVILEIVNHELPIISAINGSAAGGGLSLALAADHRLCVENAKLAMAFGNLALTPDSGSSVFFPLRFGYTSSLLGISTGKIYLSQDVRELGIFDEITDEDQLIEKALEIASTYKDTDNWVVAKTKRLLNKQLIAVLSDQLETEFKLINEACKKPAFAHQLSSVRARIAQS
ncbi:MAG: enoyl-CoA hydratase/isomerase family protein [Candidatus Kariarchaeaceae archaeon]|jgi:2-(1,2-epoxy-1,2-dihydrophenyl)acetyl-CoA isomerase